MAFKIDELFYELDARTAGFENNITHAQTSVDNFAKFIAGKPMLATAALGAAIIAVGVAATKMAADVDNSMRKIEAAFPGAAKNLDALRQTFEDLSAISPRSQAELADAAAHIAEKGVQSVSEIEKRLKVAVDLADATGTELTTVIEGLDTVGDAFQLTADQAATAITRIFGAAQGKVGLDEVIATLQRGGSVLHSLGVEAADAGEAMVALIDAGIPRRQAGTILTTILELTNRVRQLRAAGGEQAEVGKIIEETLSRQNILAKGLAGSLGEFADQVQKSGRDLSEYGLRANTVNAIQRVAKIAHDDTRTAVEKEADAFKRLQAAADVNRSSAGALWQRVQNDLNASLIRLGNEILPHVIPLLERFTQLLREARDAPDTNENRLKQLQLEMEIRGKMINQRFQEGALAHDTSSLQAIAAHPGTGAHLTLQEAEYVKYLKDIARLQKEIKDEAGTPAPTAGGDKPNLPALTNDVLQAIQTLRRSVESAVAGETVTQIDDARERVKAFKEEVADLEKKSGRRLDDLRAQGARLAGGVGVVEAKERADAAKAIANEVAQSLNLQSRIMEQGLKDFLADVDKRNAEYAKLGLAPLFSRDQIDTIVAMRQALIDTTRAAEQAEAAITTSRAAAGGRADLLQGAIGAMQKEINFTPGDTEAGREKRKRLQEQINKLQGELNSLVAQNNQLLDQATEKLTQHTKLLQDQAAAINSAVGYALQLGQAFGIVSSQTASVLQNVAAAVAGIGPLVDQIKLLHSGATDSKGNPLATIGSVLGAAAPIIGGISALAGALFGGPSPEERAAMQAQKENTAAIRELTDATGDLARINVTGAQFGQYRQLVNQAQINRIGPQTGAFTPDAVNRQLGALLDAMGLSTEQLKAFAQSFGVAVGTGPGGKLTVADFENLRKAMQASELTQFADTFTGQLQEMDAEIHLFNLTDPIKQLELFRKAIDNIKDGGGVLQSVLDSFDTSTAEGLQAAQEAIQSLFQQLQAGTLTPEQLGGLTAQEFLDALLKTSDLLRQASAGGGPLGTGGFNVSQQITEVTGSRLAAIADSSRVFLEQIAANTAETARMLGGNPTLAPITPPPPGNYGAGGAGGGDTYNITVELNGPIYGDDAEAVGGRIGDGIMQRINKGLGREAKLRSFTTGNALKAGR